MKRGPDWLAHLYLNLAWSLDSEDFAFVASKYFARSRSRANGQGPGDWYR